MVFVEIWWDFFVRTYCHHLAITAHIIIAHSGIKMDHELPYSCISRKVTAASFMLSRSQYVVQVVNLMWLYVCNDDCHWYWSRCSLCDHYQNMVFSIQIGYAYK